MTYLPTSDIEDLLESILRGAAKILGCSSANLIVFNKKTREVRIRVGAIAERFSKLLKVESVLGDAFSNMVFRLDDIQDSLVYASWSERVIHETSSLAELVGDVFPAGPVAQGSSLIGEMRFICVPVLCGHRIFGVIIFTKDDAQPFGPQRREILLRYAQRIGEIIDNDLARAGAPRLPERFSPAALAHLFIDESGAVCGWSAAGGVAIGAPAAGEHEDAAAATLIVTGETVQVIAARARRLLVEAEAHGESAVSDLTFEALAPEGAGRVRLRAEFAKATFGGRRSVLCSLFEVRPRSASSIETQLLHFALGDTAPTILVDPSFQITSCNEATESLLGYTRDELLRRPIGALFGDEREIHAILNHQFLFLSNGYFEDVAVMRHKDGRSFPGKVEALLLADEKDEVLGFMVLLHDQSAMPPLSAGAEGVEQLMRRERLATMGEMAAQLAHEIRNPLVAIGATLDMLGHETDRSSADRELLGNLGREITRLDILLRDYLSLAARRNAAVAKVDLGAVLNDARRLLAGAEEAEGKTIFCSAEHGPEVLGDYDGLRHVFLNLLRNALEATPKGGLIRCQVSPGADEITVWIDDQGPGLACDAAECLKPFFTTKKNGTGLGLTVCEKIVRAHGGALSLRNLETGGCRACVVLPRRV